ncbi:MAG TPA: radical SAM protein [Pseudomonadales bacterium]|nr:radical SAM protein [Pseudomonadales bacterium]
MAKIAIIKLFYGMTISCAQLAGQLLAHGHQPKVIFFKRQEVVQLSDYDADEYVFGDVPMRSYAVNKEGASLYDTSAWKKNKPGELRHLVTLLKELDVDAIGITCLSHAMVQAEAITAHLREHFDKPILWGGTGPTVEPDRSILHADLVCVGEGEDVFVEIAERIDNHAGLENIAGSWYRLPDGTIQKNPKRAVADLEVIGMPVWEAEHFAYINGHRFERNFEPNAHNVDKSYQMMTQRGCPFSCSFCVESFYQNEFGKKDSLRRMSPQKAIRELLYAKNILGYKTVTFMDDVFTVNPRWLEEFLTLYKKEIGLPFFCYTYPTTHNASMLAMLKDAGCHAITMGVQSGSYRILKEVYDRPTKIGRVTRAAQEIVESGIPAATFDLIPQTEFDTENDLKQTLELLLEIPKEMDSTFYNIMAYFPNYPIQEKFQDQKLLASSDRLTEDVYLYYFKLFGLTRTAMSMEQVRTMAQDPQYRANHDLLNPMLDDANMLKPNYGELIELGIQREKEKRAMEKTVRSAQG